VPVALQVGLLDVKELITRVAPGGPAPVLEPGNLINLGVSWRQQVSEDHLERVVMGRRMMMMDDADVADGDGGCDSRGMGEVPSPHFPARGGPPHRRTQLR
jgi:hypothetical protein